MNTIHRLLVRVFDSEPCNCEHRPCICLRCPNCSRRLGRWKSRCTCGWRAPTQDPSRIANRGGLAEAAGMPGIPGISSGTDSAGVGPAGP